MRAHAGAPPSQTYWAAHLLDGAQVHRDVTLVVTDGVFTSVETDTLQGGSQRLPGVVIPGLANCHSHAFHRALRGRTHADGGTFWTWRQGMYAVAAQLDPDSYLALARATYAEMALAGITSVGEFHYLHHGPGGVPYADPNAMGEALRQAAHEAGIRLTLLDTCYLAGGLTAAGHMPLEGPQLRFGDRDIDAWVARKEAFAPDATTATGSAVHSVRAVPFEQLREVAQAPRGSSGSLHAHVSEQPAENEACRAFYGTTPVQLLQRAGLLDEGFTAVHATHLTDADLAAVGGRRSTACFCPTTERDLADGIGPARALLDAGASLSLGSDQHAVIDLFEEARGLEMHERLDTLHRGRLSPAELLNAATAHAGIDRAAPAPGEQFRPGARADLVAVRLDSVRTAGSDPAQILLAATAGDVDTVLRDGEPIVQGGRHRLGDVGALLSEAIEPLWTNAVGGHA